jgi:hypothetical protein
VPSGQTFIDNDEIGTGFLRESQNLCFSPIKIRQQVGSSWILERHGLNPISLLKLCDSDRPAAPFHRLGSHGGRNQHRLIEVSQKMEATHQ